MVFRHSSISCLVRLILNPSKTTAWVVSIFFSLFQLQFHRSASSQLYCDFWSSLTITSRNHWVLKAGFPTGVANMGLLKIWWGGAGGGGGEEEFKKNHKMCGVPPMPPSHYGKKKKVLFFFSQQLRITAFNNMF